MRSCMRQFGSQHNPVIGQLAFGCFVAMLRRTWLACDRYWCADMRENKHLNTVNHDDFRLIFIDDTVKICNHSDPLYAHFCLMCGEWKVIKSRLEFVYPACLFYASCWCSCSQFHLRWWELSAFKAERKEFDIGTIKCVSFVCLISKYYSGTFWFATHTLFDVFQVDWHKMNLEYSISWLQHGFGSLFPNNRTTALWTEIDGLE